MYKTAKGSFEITMLPRAESESAVPTSIAGMSIDKKFDGDLIGSSLGELLMFRSDVEGSAGYVALERVEGTLHGRSGTFVLQHAGRMNRGEKSLLVQVVPDSGSAELTGISGELDIDIVDAKHVYEFRYSIADR